MFKIYIMYRGGYFLNFEFMRELCGGRHPGSRAAPKRSRRLADPISRHLRATMAMAMATPCMAAMPAKVRVSIVRGARRAARAELRGAEVAPPRTP